MMKMLRIEILNLEKRYLLFFPIPGKPLQARYYGPNNVDKKLSDVNYIVNNPERGKKKNSYVVSTCLLSTLIGIVLLFHQ